MWSESGRVFMLFLSIPVRIIAICLNQITVVNSPFLFWSIIIVNISHMWKPDLIICPSISRSHHKNQLSLFYKKKKTSRAGGWHTGVKRWLTHLCQLQQSKYLAATNSASCPTCRICRSVMFIIGTLQLLETERKKNKTGNDIEWFLNNWFVWNVQKISIWSMAIVHCTAILWKVTLVGNDRGQMSNYQISPWRSSQELKCFEAIDGQRRLWILHTFLIG